MTTNDPPTPDRPLRRAVDVGERAAALGFDWRHPMDATDKIAEELDELRASMRDGEPHRVVEELGDLYFAVTNVARMLGIDPEHALGRATDKFERRFAALRDLVAHDGRRVEALDLDALEEYWQRAKAPPTEDPAP